MIILVIIFIKHIVNQPRYYLFSIDTSKLSLDKAMNSGGLTFNNRKKIITYYSLVDENKCLGKGLNLW